MKSVKLKIWYELKSKVQPIDKVEKNLVWYVDNRTFSKILIKIYNTFPHRNRLHLIGK